MTKEHYNQEFFDRLAEKLEELYPKGDKERSQALVFNAYANMIAFEVIEKEKQKWVKILNDLPRIEIIHKDGSKSRAILEHSLEILSLRK